MDRDLEKLILKAEGKKWWHCFLQKKNKSNKLIKEKAKPQNAERYSVFIKTTYSENWQLGIFLFCIIGSIIALLFIIIAQKTFANEKLWASYFFLILPSYFIFNLIRFYYFRGWRKRLPFEIIGWEKLVNTNQLNGIFWRNNCSISVNIVNPDPIEIKAINAALIIFANKAKNEIYSAEASDAILSLRRKEFIVNKFTARGSVNVGIIRQIRKLCQKDLTMISKKFNNITSVIISIDEKIYTVMEKLPDPV